MGVIGWEAKIEARLAGRVPAAAVEGYARAGASVYDDLAAAEALRHDLAAAGTDLWALPPGQGSQLLATWCAFALQTLGEQLVESERAASPRRAGTLPAMTAGQATVFLQAAAAWSARARRAAADPGYDIAAETRLPAPLPEWNRTGPCPRTHVAAMLAAAGALSDRAQAALADFGATPVPDTHRGTAGRLQGLAAQAETAVSQAGQMWQPSDYQPLHTAVEAAARDALDQLFRLGQLLARPGLLEAAGTGAGPRSAGPLPGDAGFDPWRLTAPGAARALRGDASARRALEHLWRSDPDPAATLTLAQDVEQAADDGSVASTGDYYYCTPWPAIYTTRRPVTLAGHALAPGDQFTLDICASDRDGRPPAFRRGLLITTFRPRAELGYCDRDTGRGAGTC